MKKISVTICKHKFNENYLVINGRNMRCPVSWGNQVLPDYIDENDLPLLEEKKSLVISNELHKFLFKKHCKKHINNFNKFKKFVLGKN